MRARSTADQDGKGDRIRERALREEGQGRFRMTNDGTSWSRRMHPRSIERSAARAPRATAVDPALVVSGRAGFAMGGKLA